MAEDRLDADVVGGPMAGRLEIELRRDGDGFAVTGTVELEGSVRCSRCLSPVAWTAREPVTVTLLPAPPAPRSEETGLQAEELDVEFLTDAELDLEALAVQQLLLALPMRTVCSPDCAGLCPRCGANRNVPGACRCDPDVDPRWEALRSLRTELP